MVYIIRCTSTEPAPVARKGRTMSRPLAVASLCLALLCTGPAHASALTFTFGHPAQFQRWDVQADAEKAVWEIDHVRGVLEVDGAEPFTSVAVLRDLDLRQASVTLRFRFPNVDESCCPDIGVVFRVPTRTDPNAAKGPPGQYVFVAPRPDPLHGQLRWIPIRKWPPEPWGWGDMTYGVTVALPEYDPEKWLTLRVDFSGGGWHEVYLDTGAGHLPVIPKDRMLRAWVPYTESELGLPQWTPVRELIPADDPLFQAGTVGIYARGGGAFANQWLEVDSFEVSRWLPVEDNQTLAATWAQLKRQ